MTQALQPWQLFVGILAGWINEHQQAAIEYLREENRVLKEQLGGRRLRLTDDQRRRLAAKGKKLGRRVLAEIADLAVRMARENSSWGYGRIQGALENLGHRVGRTTIASILKRNGIEPAPERGKRMTWGQFLKAHWSVLAAADFFTVEVWGPRGLVTIYVFFVIELATRRVEIAGITPSPNEAWMMQIGRNLTDPDEGFLSSKRLLILDRDTKYSMAFRTLLNRSGVEIVRLPARSPNLNAYAERFVRSIKSECLSQMILFGERSLRRATREYAAHYHRERNHQGIENRLIESDDRTRSAAGAIDCSSRLGGMLRFYHRAVA